MTWHILKTAIVCIDHGFDPFGMDALILLTILDNRQDFIIMYFYIIGLSPPHRIYNIAYHVVENFSVTFYYFKNIYKNTIQ